jgi:hypothetical protein
MAGITRNVFILLVANLLATDHLEEQMIISGKCDNGRLIVLISKAGYSRVIMPICAEPLGYTTVGFS